MKKKLKLEVSDIISHAPGCQMRCSLNILINMTRLYILKTMISNFREIKSEESLIVGMKLKSPALFKVIY